MCDQTNIKIAALINWYLESSRKRLKKEGVDLVNDAFERISSDRGEKCLSDTIYSSAEHYLAARHMASVMTPEVTLLLSAIYDGMKLFPGVLSGLIRFDPKCPPSTYSPTQSYWKLRGVLDGQGDFFLRNRHIYRVNA